MPQVARSNKKPLVLQREGMNSNAFIRNSEGKIIQSKTQLDNSNDSLENEADAVADKVVNKQAGNNIQSSGEDKLQLKRISSNQKQSNAKKQVGDEFDQNLRQAEKGGTEINEKTRAEMESGFGRDFQNVRIHKDARANKMSQSIGAKAFTHGNHIYFNSGQYQPENQKGKKLLAHELTHTIQQKGASKKKIQRSEVDGMAGGELQDSASKINEYVNTSIESVRSKFEALTSYEDRANFVKKVFKKIGAMSDLVEYQSRIEEWVESDLKEGTHWVVPYSQNTKYANIKENFGFWKTFKVLGPTMLVSGVRIGSDKLGHFFHEGYQYYKSIKGAIDSDEKFDPDTRNTWTGWDEMKDFYHDAETGKQGTGTTGVYSFADLAANYSGYSFYIDLLLDPELKFDIKSYMGEHIKPSEGANKSDAYDSSNNRAHWSEETNNNMYRRNIGRFVWGNILEKNQWHSESASENYSNAKLSFYVGSDESRTKITFSGSNSTSLVSEELIGKKIPITLRDGNPFGKISPEDRTKSKYDIVDGVIINGDLKDSEKNLVHISVESISEHKLSVSLTKNGETKDTWIFTRK